MKIFKMTKAFWNFWKYPIILLIYSLEDLKNPPRNHLENLKGDRKEQKSIRITDQWRICFVWKNGEAYDVEIVDYH